MDFEVTELVYLIVACLGSVCTCILSFLNLKRSGTTKKKSFHSVKRRIALPNRFRRKTKTPRSTWTNSPKLRKLSTIPAYLGKNCLKR